MKLIPKGSNKLVKVGKSIKITNKLITEIDSREVAISDDFRVPIPDVNFQRVLSENYEIEVVDGTVAYGDVKGITEIVCFHRKIKSLKGIEYFTALTFLCCDFNPLTNLDVTQNTALTELNCWANKLTSIDVSKNTALEILRCSFNQLTSINVTKNTALTQLYCWDNQLTSLDVSQNTALTDLNCSENELKTLDLSNNLNLKKVTLKGNPGTWWKELEKDEE